MWIFVVEGRLHIFIDVKPPLLSKPPLVESTCRPIFLAAIFFYICSYFFWPFAAIFFAFAAIFFDPLQLFFAHVVFFCSICSFFLQLHLFFWNHLQLCFLQLQFLFCICIFVCVFLWLLKLVCGQQLSFLHLPFLFCICIFVSLCFPFVFEACVRIKCPNFFCLLFTASVWLLEFIWYYFGCLSLVTKNQLLAIICSYFFGALAAISFCICSFFFAIAFLFAFSLAFEACLRVILW